MNPKLKANSNLWFKNTGTDDVGFAGLPGGVYSGGGFANSGFAAYWWTSTPNEATTAYNLFIDYATADLSSFEYNWAQRVTGCSVRCIKD